MNLDLHQFCTGYCQVCNKFTVCHNGPNGQTCLTCETHYRWLSHAEAKRECMLANEHVTLTSDPDSFL